MESEISSYSGDAPPGESKNQLARVLDGCSELSAIAKYLLESDAALRHRSAGRNNSDNVFFDDIDYGLDGRPLQLIPENWQDSYIVGTSGHGSELGHEQLQAAEENQSDSLSRPTNTSQFWVDSPTRGRDVDTIVALLLISSYLSILRNLDRILARMRKALLDGNHKTIAALIPPGCQKIASGLYIEPSLLQIKVTLEIITHALGCIEKQLGLRSLHSTDQPEVPVSQRSGLLSNDTMATIVEGAFNHEKIHLHRRDYKTRRSSFSGSDDVLVADPQVSHLLISRMQDIRSIMRSKSSI
ncbi:hypothetical protein PTMSG1_01419 [Pyrenophora teres f. maculata]|nr:hypothetical protein PTMSG1_01419 [Pyrenophora teres f. maculata]